MASHSPVPTQPLVGVKLYRVMICSHVDVRDSRRCGIGGLTRLRLNASDSYCAAIALAWAVLAARTALAAEADPVSVSVVPVRLSPSCHRPRRPPWGASLSPALPRRPLRRCRLEGLALEPSAARTIAQTFLCGLLTTLKG
jgi:hypothetical protein